MMTMMMSSKSGTLLSNNLKEREAHLKNLEDILWLFQIKINTKTIHVVVLSRSMVF